MSPETTAMFDQLAADARSLRFRLEWLADERVVKTPESLAQAYADSIRDVRLIQLGIIEATDDRQGCAEALGSAIKGLGKLRAELNSCRPKSELADD